MTKTKQCPRCTRPINKVSFTIHKGFCDKIPPPDILKKCHRMTIHMMANIFGVKRDNLKKHFDALGIKLCNGKICRTCGLRDDQELNDDYCNVCGGIYCKNCGLKATVGNDTQHKKFCDKVYKHLPSGILEAREALQKIVNNHTLKEMAEMFGVSAGSIRQHLISLCIKIPTAKERQLQKMDMVHSEIINNIDIPSHKIQEALKYFGMKKVGEELEITVAMTKPIFVRMGMKIYTKRELNKNKMDYKKKHGYYPDIYTFLGTSADLPCITCKRCEMEIYKDTNDLPPSALVMKAKNKRTLPSFVNKWTQQAIPFNRDKKDKRWKWTSEKQDKEEAKEWLFFDRRVQEYYRDGELLCRFCVAELNGQPPPLPPSEYVVVKDLQETTADNDGIFDDFEDEMELMYE